MILVTERDHLNAALSRVAGITDRKQAIPILGNVHLTAGADFLTIRATNLDIEAVETIPALVQEPGVTTVDASKLSEMARALAPGSQVGMKMVDSRLQVVSGRTRINLGALDPASFPQLWAEEWPTEFEMESETLAKMIERVSYAQHPGPSDAYLQGVNFNSVGGKLRIAATNKHIITFVDGPETDLNSHTVPTRMVSEMAKLLQLGGTAKIGFSDAKVSVSVRTANITGKLLDRTMAFPDYERAIPKDNPGVAEFSAEAMMGAIRRAQIASQNSKDNTVRVTFKTGGIAVTARNSDAEAFDEIDADYDGEEASVSLNPNYLLAILGATETDNVTAEFKDNNSNIIWRWDDAGMVVTAPQRVG